MRAVEATIADESTGTDFMIAAILREDSSLPTDDHHEIRAAVRELCAHFPPQYFRGIDEVHGYPERFVEALTKAGWLAALIPEEYGGGGLSLAEASVIMEEINRSGGNSGACHGQMYNMGMLLRHGSAEQKQTYLPKIAAGDLRLQSMAVTEPEGGTGSRPPPSAGTIAISSTAKRSGPRACSIRI
jgi:acyl-CoA dehydrogenase